MISRLHSFEDPVTLEPGMVFALETYCPAEDGRSAARIEEEVVVTTDEPQVLTRFPAEELLVAGTSYVRGADFARRRTATVGTPRAPRARAVATRWRARTLIRGRDGRSRSTRALGDLAGATC